MKHIALVTYYFPPDGGAGTQRVSKFCKYLPAFGWKPIVVTRSEPEGRGPWDPLDTTIASDIADAIEIIRVPAPTLARRWPVGTGRAAGDHGWLEALAAAVERVVAAHDAAAILVTMSPFELALVGERLRRRLNVPVIYDLRDPWALDGWRTYRTILHWRADLRHMKRILAAADGIVANTHDAMRAFRWTLPSLDPHRLVVIPNGFDADDFRRASRFLTAEHKDHFRLVHTGTPLSTYLYPAPGLGGYLREALQYRPEPIVPSGRTFVHLLAAIRLLRERRHPLVGSLRFIHAGLVDDATQRCVRESGVEDVVTLLGYRPHAESVAWLLHADALFLALHDLPDGRRSLIVPGKTYEYLASGRPILGCLPPGDAADLVAASGRGYLTPPCNEEAIASRLAELLEGWADGNIRTGVYDDWVARFDRRELTRRLAGFLDRFTSNKDLGRREPGHRDPAATARR